MHVGRRSFVFFALGLTLWARSSFAAIISGSDQTYPMTAFPRFLNTLIPRDETGSATDFGIDQQILRKAGRNKGHMRLLRAGCQWLDFEARKLRASGFHDLDAASQEAIVAKAEAARARTLPRVFFNVVRRDTFRLYYTNPKSWSSIGYSGPPQPEGYLDHTEAPSR